MKVDRQLIYEKYDGHCAYCGQEIALKQMQVDHYYPKCEPSLAEHFGGLTDVNHIDNLMPSCRQCNHYKRADQPKSWRVTMATLHQRIEKIYINRVGVNFGMVTIKPWDGKFYFEKINRP
jgi:5-methylcytosine-specific restriction endonuclease McrA